MERKRWDLYFAQIHHNYLFPRALWLETLNHPAGHKHTTSNLIVHLVRLTSVVFTVETKCTTVLTASATCLKLNLRNYDWQFYKIRNKKTIQHPPFSDMHSACLASNRSSYLLAILVSAVYTIFCSPESSSRRNVAVRSGAFIVGAAQLTVENYAWSLQWHCCGCLNTMANVRTVP